MMSWSPHIFAYPLKKAPAIDYCFVKTQKSQIKATEDKTNMFSPMLYGSGKDAIYFGSLDSGEEYLEIHMDQKGCNFNIITYY